MKWTCIFLLLHSVIWQIEATGKDCTDISTRICSTISTFCDHPQYKDYAKRNCPVTCKNCPEDLDPNGLCKSDTTCKHECEVRDKTKKVCSCYRGFELVGTGGCRDIDECSSPFPRCVGGQICTNTPGGVLCEHVDCSNNPNTAPYMGRSECCQKVPESSPCGVIKAKPDRRVVGGNNSYPGQWPWQVLMYTNRAVICGGTLLNERWVVTAAHCFSNYQKGTIVELYMGVVELTLLEIKRVQKRKPKQIITHPEWNKNNFSVNDIALVELDSPVKFNDYVLPMCLPNGERVKPGTTCYAAGWGLTHQDSVTPSTILQHVDLPIVDGSKCEESYKNNKLKVNKNIMTCAGYDEGGKDACRGDSGGPLVCQRCQSCSWFLAGVVSFGSGCAQAGKYGVYTDVLKFEDWIAKETGITVTKSNTCLGPQFTQWGSWSQCPASCGSTGIKKRIRRCLNKGKPSKACQGNSEQEMECPENPCPRFGSWTKWTDCSKKCDGGIQTRLRDCINAKIGVTECPVSGSSEERKCNAHPCPKWSLWGGWNSCSKTCGDGTQKRTRTCQNAKGGLQCVGNSEEVNQCNTNACPGWSEWKNRGGCSTTCGGGKQRQTRECIGGSSCPGSNEHFINCNTQTCPVFGKWSEWGSCDVTCGGGNQQRTRGCENGKLGDDGCPRGQETETRTCQDQLCPVFTKWSAWTTCTKTCGEGTQQSTRECRNGNVGDAGCRGDVSKSRSCSIKECIGTYSPWTEWSPCTKTCGGGKRTKSRTCEGGPKCIGDSSENGDCNERKCPVFSNWSDWETCSTTCGSGEQTRLRTCLHTKNPTDCRGDASQTRLCNEQKCPGAWTLWTKWSACSVTCGSGTINRRRSCEGGAVGEAGCDDGTAEEVQACVQDECPSRWMNWQQWNSCTQTCGVGVQIRRRTCSSGRIGQGGCVPASLAVEDRSCNSENCGICADQDRNYCQFYFRTQQMCNDHVNIAARYCRQSCNLCTGHFDDWQQWGSCSSSCGQGTKKRNRICKSESCHGLSTDTRECHTSCRGFTKWSDWTLCTKSCGGGEQKQSRVCPFEKCDPDTHGVITIRRRPCNSQLCPGIWDKWGSWSSCSETCGAAGNSVRLRTCLDGATCEGEAKEEKSCPTLPPCPGTWESWGKWTRCEVTCGGGKEERTRRCLNGVVGQPNCVGNVKETRPCNVEKCPASWGPWNPWSECNGDCKQSRSRVCGGADNACQGSSSETKACATCQPKSTCEGVFDEVNWCEALNPTSCFQQSNQIICKRYCCNNCMNQAGYPYCVETYRQFCNTHADFSNRCRKFCGKCS